MTERRNPATIAGLCAAGLAAAAGLLVQCEVSVELAHASRHGAWWAVARMLAYFTILTNLGVVAYCLAALRIRRLFPPVAGGLALAIAFVGVIYATLLRHLFQPTGAAQVADLLLHTASPILFVAFWILCVPKRRLNLRHVGLWALYPALYFLYALARGTLEGFYPYPFIDANALGYPRIAMNAVLLLCAWIGGGLLMLAIDRCWPVAAGREG